MDFSTACMLLNLNLLTHFLFARRRFKTEDLLVGLSLGG